MSRKVIQLTPYYPPHLGGVERVAEALATGLAKRRDVEVWTSDIGVQGSPPVHANGFAVHRMPAFELAHTPLPRSLLRRLFTLPEHSIVHVHVAQAVWPDLVALAAARQRFRVVAHFHLDVDPSGPAGILLGPYKRHVLSRSLRRADAVLALTQGQADHIIAAYSLAPGRVHVLANGVDESYLSLRASSRPADAPLRILFVGRLELQKNVPRLLRALALVDAPVEATIVGDGCERATCESLRDDLGLHHVRFVGPQYGQQLIDWYRWADLFVLSSDREGMPLALLEAMAAGLAVLVTDVSELREQLADCGLAVRPDEHAVGDAISTLVRDRALLDDMKLRSRIRGQSFGWDTAIDRLDDLYASLDR